MFLALAVQVGIALSTSTQQARGSLQRAAATMQRWTVVPALTCALPSLFIVLIDNPLRPGTVIHSTCSSHSREDLHQHMQGLKKLRVKKLCVEGMRAGGTLVFLEHFAPPQTSLELVTCKSLS